MYNINTLKSFAIFRCLSTFCHFAIPFYSASNYWSLRHLHSLSDDSVLYHVKMSGGFQHVQKPVSHFHLTIIELMGGPRPLLVINRSSSSFFLPTFIQGVKLRKLRTFSKLDAMILVIF